MISKGKPSHQRSGYILNSNIEFEEKLNAKFDSTGNRPFAEREVNIRKAYTLTDRLWEIAYQCAGNKKAIKGLYKDYKKQYLKRKLVKLLSADQIATVFRFMLESGIEKSTTFQHKATEIEAVTLEDLRQIRKEVQSHQLLLNIGSSKELEDARAYQFPPKGPQILPFSTIEQQNEEIAQHEQTLGNPNLSLTDQISSILLKRDISIQIESLEALAQKCIEASNSSGAIQCYEFILTIPNISLDKQINILEEIKDIYLEKRDDIPKLIESYQRIADLPNAPLDKQIYALSNIGCIYGSIHQEDTAIAYYERIIALPGIKKRDQLSALYSLSLIYDKIENLEKEIECHERCLKHPKLSIEDRVNIFANLTPLYIKNGTSSKAIEAYEQMLILTLSSYQFDILHPLLELYQTTHDTNGQTRTLTRLAVACTYRDNKKAAVQYYEQILELTGTTPLQQYNALLALANISHEEHSEQIKYYKRILKIPDLQPSLKLDTLKILARMNEHINRYISDYTFLDELSSYFKQIIDLPETTPESKYTVLSEFLQKYREAKDKKREITCLERILKIPGLNPQQKLPTLQSLVTIYKSSYSTTAESRTHEAILETDGISIEQRRNSLVRLSELYKDCRDYKEVKILELILELPNLTPDLEITSLSQLAYLYTKKEQKITCYKRIFELKIESNAATRVSALHQWLSLSASSNITLTQSEISNILTHLKSIYINNCPHRSYNYSDLNDNIKKCYVLILSLPDLSHGSLQEIAAFFDYINENNQEMECYERILKISDLTSDQQLETLKKLTKICSYNEYKTKSAIKYNKLMLSSPGATSKDLFKALSALGWAYRKKGKNTKAIQSYECILTTLLSVPGAEGDTLLKLARIYRETKRSSKAIEYYDRIIKSPNVDQETKLDILKELAKLCKKTDNVDKEIWCHQQILIFPESTPEDHDESLNELTNIYCQLDEVHRTIEDYERILKFPELTLPILRAIVGQLSYIYRKTKNISKEIECYETILTLPPQEKEKYTQDNHLHALDSLVNIYNKFDDISKKIEGFERVLNLPNLTLEIELAVLKLLSDLYNQLEDPSKKIQCLERILRHLKTNATEEKDIHYNIYILINLADLYNIVKDSAKEESTLHELVLIYREVKDVDNEIKCLKRILSIPNALLFHPHPTLRLAQLYQENNDPLQAIEYYESYLKLPYTSSVSLEYHIMEQLAILYKKINNNSKAIEYYERLLIYLKSITPSPNRSEEHLLADIYLKTNNMAKRIECYQHLAILSSESNNIFKEIECYEQLLGLQTIENHFILLVKLVSLYEKTNNIEKQIEYCKQYLTLSNLKQESKINTLKKLIHLNLDIDEFIKAREYEYEILKLNPSLLITTLLIFINHPKFGLHNDVKGLINEKPTAEVNKILEILASYYWLWSNIPSKPKPLTIEQWANTLTNEDSISELERLALQPCFTVSGLNSDYFFNDPTMPNWNILAQRENDIDDDDWKVQEACVLEIFDAVSAPNEDQRNYLSKFFSQCMASKDARTPLGKQLVRKHIDSCIDFLINFRASEPENALTNKVLKDALAIMTVGGMACPDRAVVFIPTLEIFIKLLKNPMYLANVMVLMYKFEAITKTLVPEVDEEIETQSDGTPRIKETENIETYLSYCLKLNQILGLGLRKRGSMLYESAAKTVPLQLTIEPLSAAFTDEKLINFTIQQDAFKTWVNSKEFEVEKTAAIASKQIEYIAAVDDYTEAMGTPDEEAKNVLVAQILAEIKQLEKVFYINKAKRLFLDAGFLPNNQ